MSDLISRQAAIDAIKRAEALVRACGYHNAVEALREIPAIAEIDLTLVGIVYCKDCKFWKHQGWKSGWCEQFNGAVTFEEGFCDRGKKPKEV